MTVAEANSPGRGGHGDKDKIRNVIYLLGDGMGRTHVTAARERYYGAAGRLTWSGCPAVGQVSDVRGAADSGQPGAEDFEPERSPTPRPSATAWASGVKTYNAAIGVDAKGEIVPTLMEQAKKAGCGPATCPPPRSPTRPRRPGEPRLAARLPGPDYSASRVPDIEVTGSALPTADVRVTPIAEQIARNGTADVILGGGLARFDADDEEALEAQGYTVLGSPATQTVATEADLAAAPNAARCSACSTPAT